MADTLANTLPEDELFDTEGEADMAEDGSLETEVSDQIVDLDAGDDDEGEAAPDEGAAQEAESDDVDYGAKVAARINKLTGQHNQTIAAKDREIASLKRQTFDAQGAALDANVSGLKSKLEGINDALKQAMEDGDTDKQLELNDELLDVKIGLREAEGLRGRPSKREATADAGDGDNAEPAAPNDPLDALQPKAKGWAQRVGFTGWGDAQRGLALGIDSELTKEGFDPNTDDYFDELDRRMGQVYPDLYDSDDEPEPTPRPKVKTNVRGAPPITPKPGAGGNQVKLDANDYANMRRFKLDPQNPEHVKAYAIQKRSK